MQASFQALLPLPTFFYVFTRFLYYPTYERGHTVSVPFLLNDLIQHDILQIHITEKHGFIFSYSLKLCHGVYTWQFLIP